MTNFEIVQVPAADSMDKAYQIVKGGYGPGMKVDDFPYGKWIVPAERPTKEFAGRRA